MKRSVILLLILAGWALGDWTPAFAADEVEKTRPATVLLITSPKLAPSWEAFAHWKTRQGKSTRILTTREIATRYEGADLQAKIRACVLKHAKGATRWVILGGDSLPGGEGVVPDRDTKHSLHGGRLSYSDIPTDLYYVTQKSWDANGDGVFGDWARDKSAMDYRSVAAIGRIPVRTAAEIKAYTAKVIAYESKYAAGEAAKTFLYANAVPQANYKSDMLWDKNLGPAWKGSAIQRFFANKSPWDSARRYPLSPQNWIERINKGAASKMHMHGHGFLPGWVLDRRQLADKNVVARLKNETPILLTTVSCFTGQFDSRKDPAITESMLRHETGGAIAIVAPAREGVPVFHGRGYDPRDGKTQDGTTRLLTQYWVQGLSKGLTTGEALAAAKAGLAKDAARNDGYHWVLCELNLLGDPTLDMRAESPTPLTIRAPSRLQAGEQEVEVNAGRPGVTVCLWQGDSVYALATTDAAGLARLKVSPKTGEVLLTLSGPSLNTVTQTLPVAKAAGSGPR
ncbi:MAG: hypothetical protein JKY65_09340, partial [Planctomycetes bacterium]|nr:hypothetical protein [Planctomycetota bacterium]